MQPKAFGKSLGYFWLIICLSDWMINLQEFAIDLRNYFKCCPIYFASAKGTFNVHLALGEKRLSHL
jgi:hypothetical protein